uniref:Immunoglobulin V-set domain-containing protein n=1 Tax=Mola mola TaxID=94237 RepID=A0A3Q4BI60_MOLML
MALLHDGLIFAFHSTTLLWTAYILKLSVTNTCGCGRKCDTQLSLQLSSRGLGNICQEETLVIWYSGNHIYYNYDTFGRRVQFVSLHPASGNASISISDLKMTDTNTYKCKVRKVPAIESRIIQLNVMERPTKTECYAEGVVELDREVVFRCRCTEGSPPIWYAWSMDGTGKRLPCDAYVDSTQVFSRKQLDFLSCSKTFRSVWETQVFNPEWVETNTNHQKRGCVLKPTVSFVGETNTNKEDVL